MTSIVIYFSRNGENYFGGKLKNIEKGNTEVIAEYIQELDNSDLFKNLARLKGGKCEKVRYL